MFNDLQKVELALKQRDEALQLIRRVQDALDTQETGEALIEVAHNAHSAELKLAELKDELYHQNIERDLLT